MDYQNEIDLIKREAVWVAPALLNSWVNYADGYAPAGYAKNGIGQVVLRGLIKTGSVPSVAFTLPIGFRPAYASIFAVQTSPNTIGRVTITTDGNVTVTAGSSDWVSLEGIIFYTV